MTDKLRLVPPGYVFLDNSGNPLASGKIYTYIEDTTTNKDTYTDQAGGTTNANPVVLDGNGRADIWLDPGAGYKILVKTSADVTLATINNVFGVNSDQLVVPTTSGIYDENGNEQLIFATTSSAVNYLKMTNSATGNAPTLASAGSDTNVGILIDTQGTGTIVLGSADTGGVTVTAGGLTVTAGGLTVTAGGLTVTAGGLTVTAGGLTVTDGDATISSGALSVIDEDSRTATVDDILTLTSTTSGTPAAGIGTGILFKAESADENPSEFGRIHFGANDVTAGSEDTAFVISTRTAGAALAAAYQLQVTGASYYILTGAPSAARTVTFPDADVTILTGAATQAEQETGSSTTTIVTPGRQQYHPSAAKCWVRAGISGDIYVSYNVTSVTDTGTGIATVTIATDFSGAYFVPVLSVDASGFLPLTSTILSDATTVVLRCYNNATSGFADPTLAYHMVAFGDQ